MASNDGGRKQWATTVIAMDGERQQQLRRTASNGSSFGG